MEINTHSSNNSANLAATKHSTEDALNTADQQPNSVVGPEDNGLKRTESVQAAYKEHEDTPTRDSAEESVQDEKRLGRVVDITV